MGHDWIFDVLRDLKTYATGNGLPALAQKADEALRVARAEITVGRALDAASDPDAGTGSAASGPPH